VSAPFDLKPFLNGFFAASRKAKRKPGTYVVNGVKITKTGKLWSCKIGDELRYSTHLGDLKATVDRLTKEVHNG
jgi:hypothetical protein